MKKYTITFLEKDYKKMTDHLFSNDQVEQAAYLLCRMSRLETEDRLLVREVIPVSADDIFDASATHMKIKPRSFIRAMGKADNTEQCFVFVHTHPNGLNHHSSQDDAEEKKLFRTAYTRIHNQLIHASLVFTSPENMFGRVWLSDGDIQPIERIRVIGERFKFHFSQMLNQEIPNFYDRQVRAFGPEIQLLLSQLKVGIVGVGGTGSIIAEQLIRLGIGTILISDGDHFNSSNINRVYGSRVIDNKLAKVKITERLAADIGLGTEIEIIPHPITYETVIKKFRACDLIFGCTDDEWGRSILNKFPAYYYIPVFDSGVKIDSDEGTINSIQGRVTTLLPSAACLYCRGRITPDRIRYETMKALDPERLKELIEEGYAPELQTPAPAVIPFTTNVGSSAISDFLHRLTGFKGAERKSTEVIHLFDDTRVRTNNRSPLDECFCVDHNYWGRGDKIPFLDLTWRPNDIN